MFFNLKSKIQNLKFYEGVLDFIFPPKCLGCQKEGDFVCKTCLSKIQPLQFQKCPICKLKINQGEVCLKCKKRSRLSGLIVGSSYEHNPLLQKMVSRFKYKFNQDLGKILTQIILTKLNINLEKQTPPYPPQGGLSNLLTTDNRILTTVLVPVPLHFLRYWQRGFNQAEILAKEINKQTGLPIFNLLKRIRNTPQQAKLNRKERLLNLKGAFAINQKELRKLSTPNSKLSTNYKVILIDDIASTLTTLEECGKILKKNGFKNIWGMVIARG